MCHIRRHCIKYDLLLYDDVVKALATVLAIFPNSPFFRFCIEKELRYNDMCHVSDHRLPLNIQLLVFKIPR